ncbi:hypothetical protein [Pedobacter sp. SYP-B3415]|uniref:COG1470 family protein n=1 Tax=Pedobacter sp. SYP-B3415 TaxID=2496641 RepID=UPI00101C1E6E|nr:hypothetical protein [Pedobacter sp. SYP-B3415]
MRVEGMLGILFLLLVPLFTRAQGISISPSRIFIQGQPGETVTRSVQFTNTSPRELNFVASVKDWERDSLGTKVYHLPGKLKGSNAAWIGLQANSVRVAPGETRVVNFSFTIPAGADAAELTRSMLFFTQVREQSAANGNRQAIGLNILFEVGIQIYHVPDGLTPGQLNFEAFLDKGQVEVSGKPVRRMMLKIRNDGQLNKDAYVRFELTNKTTGEETRVSPVAIAMLPGAAQWVNIDLPAGLKGNFLGIAILDAGSQYNLKVAEKEITY